MAKPSATHAHAAADQLDTEFHRGLGLYDSTMVVVGASLSTFVVVGARVVVVGPSLCTTVVVVSAG